MADGHGVTPTAKADRLDEDVAAILGLDVGELLSPPTLVQRLLKRTPRRIQIAALIAVCALAGGAIALFGLVRSEPQRVEATAVTPRKAATPPYAMALSTEPQAQSPEPAASAEPPSARGPGLARTRPLAKPVGSARIRVASTRPARRPAPAPAAREHAARDQAVGSLALNETRPAPQAAAEPFTLAAQPPLAAADDKAVNRNTPKLVRKYRQEAIDEVRLLRQK